MFQVIMLSLIVMTLSYLGTGLLRRWAVRHQLFDIPNERSSHTKPIPRGGGLLIVVITLAGYVGYVLLNSLWSWPSLLAFVMGAGLISTVSWLDDLYTLPNRVRLAAHGLGAIFALLGFGYWYTVSFPLLGELSLGWLGLPVTFLWIVGLTNAYNFMDGIDGIAGGQAVVAGFGWTFLGWQAGLPLVSALGMFIAASSLGFLGHNWPPARIFMGDVGSAFLGYTFAVLAVVAAQHDSRFAVAGILFVALFVFDTIFTFMRRLCTGENVFTAHRSHLYQRLILAGYSHVSVTLPYIGLALLFTSLALLWSIRVDSAKLLLAVTVPMTCFGLWLFVIWQERRRFFPKQSCQEATSRP
jgi:UDP-N-acetylmuramyl pentapeptide phosphotransferase/UDP-N-acetylglucosamine-1-phosphate transferase